MTLTCRDFTFEFPRSPLIMGILNVTPDSFSDGGRYRDPRKAIERGHEMAEQGADMIDVGGESTRPYATPVGIREELNRVLPVIEKLSEGLDVPISIDTIKPEVAKEALEAGASVVNDVGANRSDPKLWEIVAESRAGYVIMHMQGQPMNMQDQPVYEDVVEEVYAFFVNRLDALESHGVSAGHLMLDVGIGFGKSPAHNLQLMAHLNRFGDLNRPLLVGASRKSFIGKVTGDDRMNRLGGSLASVLWGMSRGAQIFRVHDVEETRQGITLWERLNAVNDLKP